MQNLYITKISVFCECVCSEQVSHTPRDPSFPILCIL